jgi:hypothetical protein
MESPSNGLEKFLPKSIAEKRRRKKSSSTASLDDDIHAPQRGAIASRSSRSDTTSLNGSLKSNNTDPAVDGSDAES